MRAPFLEVRFSVGCSDDNRFTIVDVFTEQAFRRNQLAVFADAPAFPMR